MGWGIQYVNSFLFTIYYICLTQLYSFLQLKKIKKKLYPRSFVLGFFFSAMHVMSLAVLINWQNCSFITFMLKTRLTNLLFGS